MVRFTVCLKAVVAADSEPRNGRERERERKRESEEERIFVPKIQTCG